MGSMRLKGLLIIIITGIIIGGILVPGTWAGPAIVDEPIFTDVTPAAFSIVWTVDEPATCFAQVYRDAQGLNQVTCTVEAESPIQAEDLGVMKVLVYNLPSDTKTFYVRTRSISKTDGQITDYPTGTLPEVTLETKYNFLVVNDKILQYLICDTLVPLEGAILIAQVSGCSYPISSFSKNSGRAIIYMGDFYSASNRHTLPLNGGETLTLTWLTGRYVTEQTTQSVPPNTGGSESIAAVTREVYISCCDDCVEPYIVGISPSILKSGDLLTINGENFGSIRGASQVLFDTTAASSYPGWNDTQIQVYVPSIYPYTCGAAQVKVMVDTKESNKKQLTIDNAKPTVNINSPSEGETICKDQQNITISGNATNQCSAISKVEVRIDGGAWQKASGTTSWNCDWNIGTASEGPHNISARATDQLNHISTILSHTLQITTDPAICEDTNVIYVDKTATGSGTGTSWADAFNTIQEGINKAVSHINKEIWVARGTYNENIVLAEGVSLYGGFNGSETSLDQRNYKSNITIIDGELRGITVTGANNAMIDDFTITNGYGQWGGGIYCPQDAYFSIYNNHIHNNIATISGAGIYLEDGSITRIIGNIIQDNEALYGGGIMDSGSSVIQNNNIHNNQANNFGGGIYLDDDSSSRIIGNTIQDNEALRGGGIFADPNSTPIIKGNFIRGNMAKVEDEDEWGDGGGIFLYQTGSNGASARIHKNLFEDNQAGCGGAIFILGGSEIGISNNIFTRNRVMNTGGAISCTEGTAARFINNTYYMNSAAENGACFAILDPYTNVEIMNSIIWDPLLTDPIFLDTASDALYTVTYTDTYGWNEPGAGNINIDPGFRDPNGGDFHLEPDSPCIDAGNTDPQYNDIDGSPNDMGAYGGADPICLECFSAAIRATGQKSGNAIRVSEVTIGIDKLAQTKSAPPTPPAYTVYMRLIDQDIPAKYYGIDIRAAGKTEEIWALRVEINNDYSNHQQGGYYPELSWDPLTFSTVGTFSLWSEESGTPTSLLVADMRQAERYRIKEGDGEYFYIIWSYSIHIEMDLPAGWSMISLPVLPGSHLVTDLFPWAEVVYGFDPYRGYYRTEELKKGEGYWILHDQAYTYQLWGQPITSYTREVQNYWYMIGGCSRLSQALVDIGNIEVVYGFDNQYGYIEVQPDNLKPTKGYWILLQDIIDTANLNVSPKGSALSRFKRMKTQDQSWQLSIFATGQKAGNAVRVSTVYIGTADIADQKSAAPEPPLYTVRLCIEDLAQNKYYGKDIRQTSPNKYVWIIRVDINNDFANPGLSGYYPMLSWDSQAIDPGEMKLVSGTTETGQVLVEDMSQVDFYQTEAVYGDPNILYYTIIFKPEGDNSPMEDPGSGQQPPDALLPWLLEYISRYYAYGLNYPPSIYNTYDELYQNSIQTGSPIGHYTNSYLGVGGYTYDTPYSGLMQLGIVGSGYKPFINGGWMNPLTNFGIGIPSSYFNGPGFGFPFTGFGFGGLFGSTSYPYYLLLLQ